LDRLRLPTEGDTNEQEVAIGCGYPCLARSGQCPVGLVCHHPADLSGLLYRRPGRSQLAAEQPELRYGYRVGLGRQGRLRLRWSPLRGVGRVTAHTRDA